MSHYQNILSGISGIRLRVVGLGILIVAMPTLPSDAAVVLTVPPSPLLSSEVEPAIELDLDGDTTIDFTFPRSPRQLNVASQGGNRVLAFDEFGTLLAADLAEASFIGAAPNVEPFWASGSIAMASCANAGGLVCFGKFLGGIEYLGAEFEIAGNTHYGWIEVESRESFLFGRIHRWAYESEPGVPIRAGLVPEPSVGALLLGGLVIVARRRRRP